MQKEWPLWLLLWKVCNFLKRLAFMAVFLWKICERMALMSVTMSLGLLFLHPFWVSVMSLLSGF